MAFADFGPVSEGEVGARNGQERVEYGPERAETPTGEVRRIPQEPPTTLGNRRNRARKNPNRERLGFHYWWWNTEPNPHPLSEPDSNAWVLMAWIQRSGHAGRLYAQKGHHLTKRRARCSIRTELALVELADGWAA